VEPTSKSGVFCVAVNAPNVVMIKTTPVNASAIVINLEKFGFAIVRFVPKTLDVLSLNKWYYFKIQYAHTHRHRPKKCALV
jgi:hypothetical protein